MLFALDRSCRPLARVPVARSLLTAALLLLIAFPRFGYSVASQQPGFQKLFHLVGIPGLRRDERVNLTADPDGLSFQTKKVHYSVPYARIHQVLLLEADRRYEGRTYAAAVATYGLGSLLILKKHHVDTAVLDFVNERGGKMGIVIQMEPAQGGQLRDLLKNHGVLVVEPQGDSVQLSNQGAAEGSKQ